MLVSNQHLRRNAGIEGKHVVEREFETEHLIAYGVESLARIVAVAVVQKVLHAGVFDDFRDVIVKEMQENIAAFIDIAEFLTVLVSVQ